MPTVSLPPPQYDHAYLNGPVVEYRLPLAEARQVCAQWGLAYVDACAGIRTEDRACVIIIPESAPDPITAHYEQHERGHCNGWGRDHPDE